MRFCEEVLLDTALDALRLLPFLFLTYLLMEWFEHRAGERLNRFVHRAGALGPLVGSALGIVPQCGFSAMASNLYSGGLITAGTLLAVFLSTSDEMLPVMLSSSVDPGFILRILLVKAVTGAVVGFLFDGAARLFGVKPSEENVEGLCARDGCHCEKGIVRSALHHTLHIFGFVALVTFLLNTVIYFIGQESLSSLLYHRPFFSHLLCALVGLIPNCASSVLLTELFLAGAIPVGAMLAGLLVGSGVGLLILFRVDRRRGRDVLLLGVLFAAGVLVGLVADLTPLSSFLVG